MLSSFLKLILAILILAFFAYLALNQEIKDSDDKSLQQTDGHFLFSTNRDGATHFQMSGEKDLETIIMVHGVSGPMKVWDKLYAFLNDLPVNAVRYDLFGRGLSSRPPGDYDLDRYDQQLFDLIATNHLKTPLTLVGSSMGCIVVSNFRNRHPDLVKKIVLIGPAGFPIQASPAAKLLNMSYVGEYLMGVIGTNMLEKHHRKYFVHPENYPELLEAYHQQLLVRGTKLAILSTMRLMPVNDFQSGYEFVGKSNIPTLLIWGEEDATFPFANHVAMQKYIPQAKFVAIKGAAHLPQYEESTIAIHAIGDFIQ